MLLVLANVHADRLLPARHDHLWNWPECRVLSLRNLHRYHLLPDQQRVHGLERQQDLLHRRPAMRERDVLSLCAGLWKRTDPDDVLPERTNLRRPSGPAGLLPERAGLWLPTHLL